jgi:hypothetical protein
MTCVHMTAHAVVMESVVQRTAHALVVVLVSSSLESIGNLTVADTLYCG